MIPALIVHGGAGRIAPERHDACTNGCLAAARAGLAVLAQGGRALDAVQAAVRVLEDDPEFNAGTGAVLTRDGTVELDASIMDGASGKVGAVAAIPDLANPIDLARAILDDGEHVLLAGPAAWAFARTRGFAPAAPGSMITERSRARYEAARAGAGTVHSHGSAESERPMKGTVGAVAIDRDGHVAAATSTGGINFKRSGRVGDSPLPGCGTWADDAGGAASATGDGEAIIRATMTRMLIERIVGGASTDDATRASVEDLVRRTGGSGGVICVGRDGRLAASHSTETMPIAGGVVDGGAVIANAVIAPREVSDLHTRLRTPP